ncbi:hypothetical protein P4S64_15885 [Vibrio sp. M60_M31a]
MLRQYEAIGLWDHIRKEQMRDTFTQTEEIANVVAFLVSEKANCINGCTQLVHLTVSRILNTHYWAKTWKSNYNKSEEASYVITRSY